MNVALIANSKNDEYYTPKYAIIPLLKYINKNDTIWCPFDTEESFYVKVFQENGNNVINTHIKNGGDFFNIDVPKCDVIISNPPYSKKTEVLEHLFEIGKPFAMLVGVVGLFESKRRFDMFKNNEFEIMYFDKRISYMTSYNTMCEKIHPPFSSIYICSKFLDKKIVFEELDKTQR